MTTESKEAIIHEWKEWMLDFLKSQVQVLKDLGAKVHNIDDDAHSVLANRIVNNYKVNLLQEFRASSSGLQGTYSDAPAPLSTNALFSPHIKSSSTVEASLSASSLKSRERPGDSLVEVKKRRRLEKGPATFRSLVDIAHAMTKRVETSDIDTLLFTFTAPWDI
ncbi:hypothetical protein BGX27_002914 [Mortierella sp. AM989]|nr:hypothetical protein BGX27_002914 [Mortierella sp. AM989]